MVGSALFSCYILISNDTETHFYKTTRIVLKFSTQQIRSTLLITILERIVATTMLENYTKFSESFVLYITLTILTFVLSAVYTFYGAICKFFQCALGSFPPCTKIHTSPVETRVASPGGWVHGGQRGGRGICGGEARGIWRGINATGGAYGGFQNAHEGGISQKMSEFFNKTLKSLKIY